MHYDIAIKRLMEIGGKDLLREFAGVELAHLDTLEEASQETFDVKRCDYAGRFTKTDGSAGIAVVEFQTRWNVDKPLDLAIYCAQQKRRHALPVLPVMVLFTPDSRAAEVYEDENMRFRFRLVRVSETNAEHWLRSNNPSLWPIAALARDGESSADIVDQRLHEIEMPRREKSDLLTIFALFLALKNVRLARMLAMKRRELMIESPFYEVIKAEGRVEGQIEARIGSLLEILDERFSPLPNALKLRIQSIHDSDKLAGLLRTALRSRTLEEFQSALG